jgi:hypothetical protein
MPNVRQNPFAEITEALLRSGYTSLDAQAQALGISRSTAWTIINGKHKRGRLHANTTIKILANPALPPQVRAVVETYAASVELDTALPSHGRVRRVKNGSAAG